MEDEETIRAEARRWLVGTLLVVALTAFAAWRNGLARRSAETEKRATERAAPAPATSPRTP